MTTAKAAHTAGRPRIRGYVVETGRDYPGQTLWIGDGLLGLTCYRDRATVFPTKPEARSSVGKFALKYRLIIVPALAAKPPRHAAIAKATDGMTELGWRAPAYSGDRHLAMCGGVSVGAVFPPIGGKYWRWRSWVGTTMNPASGTAVSEEKAKAAVTERFARFLELSGLQPKPGDAA